MERESFEDEEVARVLNTGFIAIKVDREERPDIDQIYMDAVQLMTGGGGWPMTTILAPDRRPFFGGTYFRRSQLLAILHEAETRWRGDREALIAQAAEVTARITEVTARPSPTIVPAPDVIESAVRLLARRFDRTWGGSGSKTKFPSPPELDLLLRYFRRTTDTGALDHVALGKMPSGGIRDHIGGGFHRYATDRQWRVPHFEKMLPLTTAPSSRRCSTLSGARICPTGSW